MNSLAKEYHQKWTEARTRMQQAAYTPAAPEAQPLAAIDEPKESVCVAISAPRVPPMANEGLRRDLQDILNKYNVTWLAIINHNRKLHTHPPRREIYKYLHKRGWSVNKIARFCNRDHSSVLYALKKGEQDGQHSKPAEDKSAVTWGLSVCGEDQPTSEAHSKV